VDQLSEKGPMEGEHASVRSEYLPELFISFVLMEVGRDI
jgi:hypothetical protein